MILSFLRTRLTLELSKLLLGRVHDVFREVVSVVVRQVVRLSELVVAPVSSKLERRSEIERVSRRPFRPIRTPRREEETTHIILQKLEPLRIDLVVLELENGGFEESGKLVVVSHRAEDDRSSAVHDLASKTSEFGVVDLLGHVVSEEVGEESARSRGKGKVRRVRRSRATTGRDVPSTGGVDG